MTTLADIAAVTEEDISTFAAFDSLGAATMALGTIMGITDGDVAAQVFGGDYEENWPTCSVEQRADTLRHWVRSERLYAGDAS